jgi:hypothetical protein
VDAAAPAGLREAAVAELVEQRSDDVEGDGPGLRERRPRLGVEIDSQLVGVVEVGAAGVPGWKVIVPRLAAQTTSAGLVTCSASACRPDGKVTRQERTWSGTLGGNRFW